MVNVQMVKERLSNIQLLIEDIEDQRERLQTLTSKIEEPRHIELTGMPRNPSPEPDQLSVSVIMLDQVRRYISKKSEKLESECMWIERVLEHITCSKERCIIRRRYVDGELWPDVIFNIYGNEADFIDREQTYNRKAYRIHGNALDHMAEAINTHNLW